MNTVEQPVTENLWWVIPEKLAGVRKPTAPELAELQAAGVGAIVSVLDDSSALLNPSMNWWVATFLERPLNPPQVRDFESPRVPQNEGLGGKFISLFSNADSSNLESYQQSGIPHLWLPIKGGTAPDREQIQQFQTFVDEQNRLGRAVAVHCTNGKRRTGVMLASYLINAGSSYENATQTISVANPDIEFRAAQIMFLQALATGGVL